MKSHLEAVPGGSSQTSPAEDPVLPNGEECGALAATLDITRWRELRFQDDCVANGRVVIMPLFSVLFTTIEDIKRMPKVNPRGVNEVSEDLIATISIEEIQRILKEDVNTIYDALLASDYIEEIA